MAALALGKGSVAVVADLLSEAHIVKAFNTVHFAALADRAGQSPALGIPLAGDDPAAEAIAGSVVEAAGFAPVLAGPLHAAARFDFGTPLLNVALSEASLRQALAPSF